VARPWGEILPHAMVVLVPMAVLLIALFVLSMPAGKAVVWACVSLIVIGFLDLGRRGRIGWRDVLRALIETGEASVQILMICAVAGMIIGLLSSSGLSFGLSFVLIELGRSSLFLLLVLTALVSIILGMGLPTTGVYLLLATLAAPPLMQLGIGGIEAHFFVLYFGLLSMISPPVALAAFAAASIAGASAMKTAVEAVRFGWIAFILPFVFVYQPALLMQGSAVSIVVAGVSTLIAVPLVTAAFVGFGRRPLTLPERLLSAVLGFAAILPHGGIFMTLVSGGGAVLGALLIAVHVRAHRGDVVARVRP